MNWLEKLAVGQIVKRLEKKTMNLSRNTTTTLLGILTILAAITNAGIAILDQDPTTVFNWQITLGLITAGVVGIKAREEAQHQKDVAAKKGG